jgi:phage shock protein PspC (stress-responsive transcriptional regulator)
MNRHRTLFAFMLIMFGAGTVIVQYFNLPINLPTSTQQLPSLDWGSVYFSPGVIVFGVFAVIGTMPLIAYLLCKTIFKSWFNSDNKSRSEQ